MAFDRVHAVHFDARVFLFEESPGTGNGPAGAEPSNEVGDFAIGLSPDFGAGRSVVGLGVGGVFVLVEVVVAGLLAEFGGEGDGAFRGTGGRAEFVVEFDDFRAEEAQRGALLGGNLLRECGGELVAFGVGDHGEAHAGVAGSGFDKARAIFENAPFGRILNEVGGDPVLDGAEGVVPFELRVDDSVLVRDDPVEADKWGWVIDAREELKHGVVDSGLVVHLNLLSEFNVGSKRIPALYPHQRSSQGARCYSTLCLAATFAAGRASSGAGATKAEVRRI